jgi:tyrosyl-tRNA synthetase
MDKIDELLTRGVDKIYPTYEDLEKVLKSGKKLRLYQGFDPTGTQLHIGHMVGFRKHRQWQDLGHEVIFLIGDGTGQAGDPTDKNKTREKFFTNQELRDNARDYINQASKIVRFDGPNPVKVMYNGDWLNKLTLVDILNIAQHFSVQQLIERDMFQERIKSNESINLREFIYPLLQGYDSVHMDVDLELGATDQTFNMLAGRTLLKAMRNKDKFVMTTPLLTDSNGVKIGKTEGNVIALTDAPNTLFRKIMALGDDVIVKGLEYLTDVPMDEIKGIENELVNGANPMDHKKKLAYAVTKQLNSEEEAIKAQEEFERVVQKGQLPENIAEIEVVEDTVIDDEFLVQNGLANSKSDAKRLFEQNGVSLNEEKIKLGEGMASEKETTILRVGRKMIKLNVK